MQLAQGIKRMRMLWVGHVAQVDEMEMPTEF